MTSSVGRKSSSSTSTSSRSTSTRSSPNKKMLAAATTIAFTTLAVSSLISPVIAADTCPFANADDAAKHWSNNQDLWTFKYAKNLNVSVNGHILTVSLPNQEILLYPCNTLAPTPPPNVKNPLIIQVPISSVSITSDGLAPFFDRLGHRQAIQYADPKYLTTGCLVSLSKSTSLLGKLGPADYQGVTFGTSGPNKVVDVAELIASETSALARAEWIKFFDMFFMMDSVSSQWKSITDTYSCITTAIKNSNVSPAPVIAVGRAVTPGSNGVYKYDTPRFVFWNGILTDAGVSPVVFGDPVDFDTWKSKVLNANVYVDLSVGEISPYGVAEFTKYYGGLTKTSTGVLWLNQDASNLFSLDRIMVESSNDFLQSQYSQPELLLADLVHLIDSKFSPTFHKYWFRNLANGDANVTPDSCPSDGKFQMYLQGAYCASPTTPYQPNIINYNPSSSPDNNNNGGNGGSSGSSSNAIIITCVVLLVAAGVAVGGLFLARRFARNRFVKMNESEQGVSLQDMTW
ncbi:hypothetical protein HDU76_006408 [Blyttiomyces sp. JEL0837]|nr:hypothetical protein HDU76_006408 [Blyttiomyces sp. JEL0837]